MPGVVLTTRTETNPGSFSGDGQRLDANYSTVDGVGANLAIIPDLVLNQVRGGARLAGVDSDRRTRGARNEDPGSQTGVV